MLRVPVPLSDVVDRVVILDLKLAHLQDGSARAQVAAWRQALLTSWEAAELPDLDGLPEIADLRVVNAQLWDVEDRLRRLEALAVFDEAFVEDARSVYRLNDRRAALKSALDRRLDSALTDIKAFDKP